MDCSTIGKLNEWGPGNDNQASLAEAQAYCRSLTLGHYENFSVLSRIVPDHMRDGVSAVYAFCRWADDLADESPDPETAKARLGWWRDELNRCMNGEASHPVFVALREVNDHNKLPPEPFHHLIDAFESDQDQNQWDTWEDLIRYCEGSANPVGRLVLHLAGESQDGSQLGWSDAVCTGLQLANHWQDVQRDVIERGRVYIPLELMPSDDFIDRLVTTAKQGYAPDQTFLEQYRELMSSLIGRTRPLLEQAGPLIQSVRMELRPMLRLFAGGGHAVLDQIERTDCETVLHRVSISKVRKMLILWRAMRAA